MKRTIPGSSLFLIVLLVAGSGIIAAQDLSSSLFTQGMQLYNQKDFSGAADYLGQVVDMNASHAQARLYLVYSLMAVKQYGAAAKHADALCRMDPSNAQYKGLKGQIEQYTGVPRLPPRPAPKNEPKPAAEPTTMIFTTSTPRTSPITLPKTPVYSTTRPTLPKPYLPAKTSNTPVKDLTPTEKAVQEMDSQNYASAAALLDDVLSKEKNNHQANHFRGMLEHLQGKYESARKFLDAALKIKPDYYDSQFLLGDTYFREGRYKEAEEAFVKALKIKEDPTGMMTLAETRRLLGKIDEAIEMYEKVTSMDEKQVEARIFLAQALLDKNEIDRAGEMINQALTKEPDNAMARFVRGKILFKSELYEDAVSSIKHAINLSPENLMFKIFLAQVYVKTNHMIEALDQAGKITATNPENWEARMVLAHGLFQNGDFNNAEVHLDKAEEMAKTPETTLLRAKLARKKGDTEKAFQQYQLYLSQDQTNAEIYLDYAQTLEDMGELSSAADVYRDVKSRFPDGQFANVAEGRLNAVLMKSYSSSKSPGSPPQPRPTGPKVKVEY